MFNRPNDEMDLTEMLLNPAHRTIVRMVPHMRNKLEISAHVDGVGHVASEWPHIAPTAHLHETLVL